jgi:hypothetical protein
MLLFMVPALQGGRNRRHFGIDEQAPKRHPRNVLEDHSIVGCRSRSLAPGERSVSSDQHSRCRHGIEIEKTLDDDLAGVELIRRFNLLVREGRGDVTSPRK